MARIRSIHPGIWTDEDFAMLSMASRVLLFGIWTDADDHGIFEWKPVALKMRIFPADKVDLEPLLDDLMTFDKVKRFTFDGREYGAVRNFCRYQRPKKPSYKHVMPDEIGIYVGLKPESTEPVENQFGTGEEISPQRKEEGGRREEVKKDSAGAGRYAFEQGVIKLNERDLEKWKRTFSHIDVPAELLGLSKWAESEGKNWFHAVQGALNKRNREVKAAKDQQGSQGNSGGQKWLDGIEGVI